MIEQRKSSAMLKRNRLYERSPWRLLLTGGLGLALLYVLLPYGLAASALYVLATLAAAVSVTVAVYREKQLFCSLAWKLVAMALALAAMGHGIWYWLDLVGLEPFPSAADIFYLAIYPLFMMALWLLGKRKNTDDSALSDALIIGISAGVLGWALLIEPYVNAPDITLLQLLVSTAYPVADLILLPMILHLVFLQRTRITAHHCCWPVCSPTWLPICFMRMAIRLAGTGPVASPTGYGWLPIACLSLPYGIHLPVKYRHHMPRRRGSPASDYLSWELRQCLCRH